MFLTMKTVGFSPIYTLECRPYALPLGNPIKSHEEFSSLQRQPININTVLLLFKEKSECT